MSTIQSTILALFLLLSLQASSQVKYSKIRIRLPEDASARQSVINLMEADHFHSTGDGVVAELSEHAIANLRAAGHQVEIIVDYVTKHFQEQSKIFFEQARTGNRVAYETSGQSIRDFISTPSFFSTNGLPPGSMGGYYTFSQMNSKMDELVAAFPNLVQKTSIGLSVEGRDIWCLKISDNVTDDEEEPEVLYLGLQHAREAITGTSLIFFAQYLAQNYGAIQSVTELVSNREIFIVPCVNPDGYVYNQTNNPGGGGMQRKNRRNVGSDITGQKGVDLNRNYGVDWNDCAGASTSCGSDNPSYETYWGSGPFSEPETQAIRDLCYSRNFVAAFDQHCAGPYYSLPFGRRSYHTMPTLDQYFYTFIPALMGKYNGHRAGDSYATVQYEVAGGAKDWWLLGDIESYPGEPSKKGKVYGMTGEAGGGGFWAPSSQIIELCKNLCFQNMQLAFAAGSYVDLQDANDIAVNSTDTVMRFNIRRIGIGDEPVIVNLIPLQNIGSTKADTINTLPVYYDSYAGSVPVTFPPGLGNGQRIRFVWRVQTGGITIYDTVTKIYNPVTLFSDDMETGTVSSNWEVSSGWDYVSAGGVNTSRALTESPSGNYTSSSTRIASTRNPLDLSNATTAYISFWTRHRAENFRDILRLQISTNSTDGLNGTWTSLVGRNTVQENNTTNQGRLGGMPALTGIRENWTRELIEIPSGFYNSSNVRFRFEFSSDATAFNDFEKDLDDGFYIDDFKIVKSTSTLVTLPVQFLRVAAQLLPDETVRVDWEAITDRQHDYFEVEKSADGMEFSSIGRGPAEAPYRFIDTAPYIGINFYRIKQFDKDGTVSFSSTVSVFYNPAQLQVLVYPNPVKNAVKVKVNGIMHGTYSVNIVDMEGREIFRQPISSNAAGNEISIDLNGRPGQLYLVMVRNEKAEIVAAQKIIKEN